MNSQTNVDALHSGAIPVGLRWTPPFTAANFDPVLGWFAPWTSHNGVITVAYEPEEFNARRRRYIDHYRAVARSCPETVSKLATDIEQYFEKKSGNAGVDSEDAAVAAIAG